MQQDFLEESKLLEQKPNITGANDNFQGEQSFESKPEQFIQREPTEEFCISYQRLKNRLLKNKPHNNNRNNFVQIFRIFNVPSTCALGFISNEIFLQKFGEGISACYIFKLKYPHKDGYNHGLYLRVNGYAPRRIFETFAEVLLKFLSGGFVTKMQAVVPNISKHICLFDYLLSLYVHNRNLLVNYSSHIDAVPQQMISSMPTIWDHFEVSRLTNDMKRVTHTILENMVSMPSLYPGCNLYCILQMNSLAFRNHMRFTTLNEVVLQLCQDAYNQALQDTNLSVQDVHQLMDPLTRRSLINKFMDDRITKQVQLILQQTFNISFVHPHPYVNLSKGDLPTLRPFDAMVFDPRFLLPLLMCSRWFSKSCMRTEAAINNNNAHLLLYGQSGAGKSLILSIISSNIPTYRYLTNGRFQNPEILSSALLFIDELDTTQLTSNQYKALLDIKAPVKVDFKNLHPENVTEDMPCMISTNDEIFGTLRNAHITANTRRAHSSTYIASTTTTNQNSIDAALRRLYVVPVKLGQFDKLHGQILKEHPYYNVLCYFNNCLEDERDKLSRIFNFIVTFALFQTDIANLTFDGNMQYYLSKLVRDFRETVFGMFYILNKAKVDKIIESIEKAMVQPDINDTEYLADFTIGVGELAHTMKKFLRKMAANNSEIIADVIDEPLIPWPLRIYYLKSSMLFVNKVSCQCDNFEQYLNEDVKNFIWDRNIQPYHFEEVNPYGDLNNDPTYSEDDKHSYLLELVAPETIIPENCIAAAAAFSPKQINNEDLDTLKLGKRPRADSIDLSILQHDDDNENTFDVLLSRLQGQ